jgi:hypothetical protein
MRRFIMQRVPSAITRVLAIPPVYAVVVLGLEWGHCFHAQTFGVPATGDWYYWQAAGFGFVCLWIIPLCQWWQGKLCWRDFAEGLLFCYGMSSVWAAANWALDKGGTNWPALALASGFVIGLTGALCDVWIRPAKNKGRRDS